eukprot:CFRG2971T1
MHSTFNSCITLSFAIVAWAQTELISNPSLETSDEFWTSVGNGYSRTNYEQTDGDFSAQIEAPTEDWSGIKAVIEMNGTTEALTVNGWGMLNDELSEAINSNLDFGLSIRFDYDDLSVPSFEQTLPIPSSEAWSWHNFGPITMIPVKPVRKLTVICGIRNINDGTAWCDNISVIKDVEESSTNTSVNCQCNRWGAWSECSESCDGGLMSRERECLDTDKNEDDICQTVETVECNANPCSVEEDGCYCTEWLSTYECPVSCGGGVQKYERVCHADESLVQSNAECKDTDMMACNSQACPDDNTENEQCVCDDWGEFSACASTSENGCGEGVVTRERSCTNASIINGVSSCQVIQEVACEIPCSDGMTETATIPLTIETDIVDANADENTGDTSTDSSENSKTHVIIGVVVTLFIVLMLAIIVFLWYRQHARKKANGVSMSMFGGASDSAPPIDDVSVSSAPLTQRVSEWRSKLIRHPDKAKSTAAASDESKTSDGLKYEQEVTV